MQKKMMHFKIFHPLFCSVVMLVGLSGCKRYVCPILRNYQGVECRDVKDCDCSGPQTCSWHTWSDVYNRGQTIAHADVVVWSKAAHKAVYEAWGAHTCIVDEPRDMLLLWGPHDDEHLLSLRDDDGRSCATWCISLVVDDHIFEPQLLQRIDEIRPYQKWLFGKRYTAFRDLYRVRWSEEALEATKNAHKTALLCRSGTRSFEVKLSCLTLT